MGDSFSPSPPCFSAQAWGSVDTEHVRAFRFGQRLDVTSVAWRLAMSPLEAWPGSWGMQVAGIQSFCD